MLIPKTKKTKTVPNFLLFTSAGVNWANRVGVFLGPETRRLSFIASGC